ncbi:unnamed protein product [Adineta ricciae]|uniref:G domain-containing protein n=1 Tax=Adineta ricciae TaxID=249248 RepID=A0A813P6W7_ADIRI|nr:unnamed protein product [Adineta ricciae]CAF1136761.1 unnamed protein product [Adineta ricciae]
MINVDSELRLSLLLKLAKRCGIAQVLNEKAAFDENTRFIYYSSTNVAITFHKSYLRRKEALPDAPSSATHVLNTVNMGIVFMAVLRLPTEAVTVREIDFLLETIRAALSRTEQKKFRLISEQKKLLDKILQTKVYSNLRQLADVCNISKIFEVIEQVRMDRLHYIPVAFSLVPVRNFCKPNYQKPIVYSPLSHELSETIEENLIFIRNSLTQFTTRLDHETTKLLVGHLSDQLNQLREQHSQLAASFTKTFSKISNSLVKIRCRKSNDAFDNMLLPIKTELQAVIAAVKSLENKGRWITQLRQQNIEYINFEESSYKKCKTVEDIQQMLLSESMNNRALCTNDNLNTNQRPRFEKLYQLLRDNYQKNTSLRLHYIDFSYSKFPLSNIVILPNEEVSDHINHTRSSKALALKKSDDHAKRSTMSPTADTTNLSETDSKPSSSLHTLQATIPEVTVHPKNTLEERTPSIVQPSEPVTILLLGESGVGKSTFINAIANYLTFDSFQEAESSEPVVLIPVSFVITVGDNFEEHIIKFGEIDYLNNEDFDHPGQSVTQHCKSYLFNLKHKHGKQLRIIDTPGLGDTRGLDQDERNMEHILQYVNNLTHINAICFLLKPNTSRLHIVLRTCFQELFAFLHPSARQNLIFCFTNARSTFYTPGDTAPILKAMLQSLSIENIVFNRANTFCFDNEAFRFLVALQNDISFDEENKREYEMSWSKSVVESAKLIKYIDEELTVYRINNSWTSIRQAQFEILYMVRPILETMRNILRNIILFEKNILNESVELHVRSLSHVTTRCLSCQCNPTLVGHFWVILTNVHDIQTRCLKCECSVEQHVQVDYIIEYQCQQPTSQIRNHYTREVLNQLLIGNISLGQFLANNGHFTKADPFLNVLTSMINEEKYICRTEPTHSFNSELLNELLILEDRYRKSFIEMKSEFTNLDLSKVYKVIDVISQYPMIQKQMKAVKQTQQKIMEQYEYDVNKI